MTEEKKLLSLNPAPYGFLPKELLNQPVRRPVYVIEGREGVWCDGERIDVDGKYEGRIDYVKKYNPLYIQTDRPFINKDF